MIWSQGWKLLSSLSKEDLDFGTHARVLLMVEFLVLEVTKTKKLILLLK